MKKVGAALGERSRVRTTEGRYLISDYAPGFVLPPDSYRKNCNGSNKSQLCSPGEAGCKPSVLSPKHTSHVWIQLFGCVNYLEAINNKRLMVCVALGRTEDFISAGDCSEMLEMLEN